MTASWHNIRPEYNKNKLVISKDGGNKWEVVSFPAGIFDYEDINEFIHKRIGKTGNEYGINVLFDLSTFKVFIQLENGFQTDFTKSGNFNILLGFEKKIVSRNEYGKNFPNISNSVDNLYLRSSLLSDSIISGKRSNVLYSFSTSTKMRSMPFEIQPFNYLWSKINTKTISEVTFWFTDDEDREVDLNEIDISLTVVIKKDIKWRLKDVKEILKLLGGGFFGKIAAKLTGKTASKLASKAAEKLVEKGAEKVGEKTGQLIGEKIYNKFSKPPEIKTSETKGKQIGEIKKKKNTRTKQI